MTGVKVLVTTGESRTGDYVVQNLLDSNSPCKKLVEQVSVIYPSHLTSDTLTRLGANLESCDVDKAGVEGVDACLKKHAVDTIVLIPPASAQKVAIAEKYLQAIKNMESSHPVKNVVLVSTLGADCAEGKEELQRFAEIEQKTREMLKDCKTHCCIVRTAPYMQNHLLYVRQMHEKKFLGIPIPGDAKLPQIDARDVGAAVAILACSVNENKELKEQHRGKTYTVASPEVTTPNQVVEEMLQQVDRLKEILTSGFKQISRKEAEEYLSTIKQLDSSESMLLQDVFDIIREGKVKDLPNDLQTIFNEQGLEPRTFKEWAKEYAVELTKVGEE